MKTKKAGWKQKLMAFIASSVFVFVLLGIGELYCCYFLEVNFRKTTKDFVISDSAGSIFSIAANASGISFGVPVFSDEYGFRIPEGHRNDQHGSR